MSRLHYNLVRTALDGAHDDTTTTLTVTAPFREGGSGGALIATIAAPDTLAIRVDDEIMTVTAYTSGATTATVVRGEADTAAAAHADAAVVKHVIEKNDIGADAGGGLLAIADHAGGSDAATYSTTSTSLADVDAANLAVTVLVPASGNVLIRAEANLYHNVNDSLFLGLRESTTDIASHYVSSVNGQLHRVAASFYLTGLTPGSTHTYKLAWKVGSGTGSIYSGPTFGKTMLEAWSA